MVDDHDAMREGLTDVLNDRPGLEVVGDCSSAEQCFSLIKNLKPDVVLMDIKMRGLSGLEATRKVKTDFPEVKVVMFTTYEDEAHVLEAFLAGADGYAPKTDPVNKLIETLRRVHEEGPVVPPALLPKLIKGIRGLDPKTNPLPAGELTATEITVLSRVKKGLPNKEIGQELNISEKTVRNHLNNAFDKLGAKNRTEAIVKALQRGILSLED